MGGRWGGESAPCRFVSGGGDSASAAVCLDCNKMPEGATDKEKRLILVPYRDFGAGPLAIGPCIK